MKIPLGNFMGTPWLSGCDSQAEVRINSETPVIIGVCSTLISEAAGSSCYVTGVYS